MTTNRTDTAPRVWLADLAAYNAGHLHGEWVDLTDGADAFDAACKRIITTSPVWDAEELAVHDIENGAPDCYLTAYRVAQWFDDSGEDSATFQRLVAAHDGNVGDALDDTCPDDALSRVYGPFEYGFEADSEAETIAYDRIAEGLPFDVSEYGYVKIDISGAVRDLYSVTQYGGAWYVIESE